MRQDGLSRYAKVRHARPGHTPDQGAYSEAATSIGVETVIHQHSPDVRVRVSPTPSSSTTSTIWGWRVPPWLGGFVLAGVLCSLVLLATGPEPWRATMGSGLGAALRRTRRHVGIRDVVWPNPLGASTSQQCPATVRRLGIHHHACLRWDDHELVVAHVRMSPSPRPKREFRQAGSRGRGTWRRAW